MATIKLKLRASTVKGRPSSVYYQMCHAGKVRMLSACVYVTPDCWDAQQGRVVVPHQATASLRATLFGHNLHLDAYIERFHAIVHQWEVQGKAYTLKQLVEALSEPRPHDSVLALFEHRIQYFQQTRHRHATAHNHYSALSSFREFLMGHDITFSQITPQLVDAYQQFLLDRGLKPNSTSFHMRHLRALYNQAARLQLCIPQMPFAQVFTGVASTPKRALPEQVILQLAQLTLPPHMQLTRTLYLFSYAMRGMPFVDIAMLRLSDLHDGYITYRRSKTGAELTVFVEPFVQRLLQPFLQQDMQRHYLFPLLTALEPEERYKEYRCAYNRHARILRSIGSMLGLAAPLTFHTSRHTWATMARMHQVPLAVISQALGHASERTTQVYLNQFQNEIIDKANREILAPLQKFFENLK